MHIAAKQRRQPFQDIPRHSEERARCVLHPSKNDWHVLHQLQPVFEVPPPENGDKTGL